ncbi:hypothetical protein [Granulicella sp. S156]|jgi:hypothetical protein|uniref:hypothetical protein n=1 Tax=Granulicella sp. S156 TaxID=1747224 RepID=UPI00131E0152|nr:hypothetical protein [Granulicella sp. S156]
MTPQSEHRAEPPRIPAPTRTLERAQLERKAYFRKREQMEHRSLMRGLFLLALLVLVESIARAGVDRVFIPGWWRP